MLASLIWKRGSRRTPQRIPSVDAKTIAMIRRSGVSWWVARYKDGREIAEWKTTTDRVPFDVLRTPLTVNARASRWEEIDKDGLTGVALACPNGRVAVVEAPRDHAVFQLKLGRAFINASQQRTLDAHIIGALMPASKTGHALVWAYETHPHPYTADLDYPDGRCSLCALTKEWCSGRDLQTEIGTDGSIALVGRFYQLHSFEDNVTSMRYMKIGPLNLDVQGLVL